MAPIIEVKKLKKSFKSYKRGAGLLEAFKTLAAGKAEVKRALKGISFKVEKGEILGMIGPNGAGKSTAIKAMCGVMLQDSGTVKCLDFDPWYQREQYVKNIGVVFGPKSLLWWDLPAIDTFYFIKELYDIPSKDFGRRVSYFTKLLDVEDVSKIPVRNLSLGERMKCNLIAALLHNPKIVFLDEPTVGVDLIAKDRIRAFIEKVNREEKTTFVITTHDMGDIEKLCKRIIIINHGEIIYDGLLSKIKDKYVKEKHLNIKFAEPIKSFKFKGSNIIRVSEYELKIEINLREQTVENVMAFLLKKFKLVDITIANPPIEEIIKQIYRK